MRPRWVVAGALCGGGGRPPPLAAVDQGLPAHRLARTIDAPIGEEERGVAGARRLLDAELELQQREVAAAPGKREMAMPPDLRTARRHIARGAVGTGRHRPLGPLPRLPLAPEH